MDSKGFYSPRREGRVDWDLCEEQEDGSWRDAAGRLIYQPTCNLAPGSFAHHLVQAHDDDPFVRLEDEGEDWWELGLVGGPIGAISGRSAVSFTDPTFDEAYANLQRASSRRRVR